MGTGRFLSSSVGPEPFPGVPIKEPLQPQQPGEVLIRYELEAVSMLQRPGMLQVAHFADKQASCGAE